MDLHLPSYPYSLPQLRSVRHLTFLIDYHFIFRPRILQFIYFCPNLVELIILQERGGGAVYVPSRFSDFANLRHLQYLCVDSLHSEALDQFKEWLIGLGSSTTSHPLSHVKVGLAYAQSDIDVLQLVDVLDQYSIRSLYLDGLLEGRPELISGIAERLPGLETLTLLHRAGRREGWLCSWPEPVFLDPARASYNLRTSKYVVNMIYLNCLGQRDLGWWENVVSGALLHADHHILKKNPHHSPSIQRHPRGYPSFLAGLLGHCQP